MLRKVSELIEYLNTLEPDEEIVDLVWSKRDVEYALSEIQSNNEEGVTQEDIERFDIEKFWEHLNIDIENQLEGQVVHELNDDIYFEVLSTLKQEDARA